MIVDIGAFANYAIIGNSRIFDTSAIYYRAVSEIGSYDFRPMQYFRAGTDFCRSFDNNPWADNAGISYVHRALSSEKFFLAKFFSFDNRVTDSGILSDVCVLYLASLFCYYAVSDA